MKLKEWRRRRGLTLEQLSSLIGYSVGHLSDIENGKKNGSVKLFYAYKKLSGGTITAADFFE